MNIGGLVDKLYQPLDTHHATAQTVDSILETLIIASPVGLSLLLDQLQHNLNELHNGENQRAKGQTAQMVP